MIKIDGSDGGGQLLRTALSLSALTKKPFKMSNIRGKREKAGLQRQHLTAVNSIAKICNAKVKGNELHSKELEFIPSEVIPDKYKFDIGTAGSTTLVLQTLLPPLAFADKKSIVEIIGGTANPLAPPASDIKEVFLWYLKKLGIEVKLEIEREGFYPAGQGKIIAVINPIKELKEIDFTEYKKGKYEETKLIAVCSKELENREITKRLINGFKLEFPIVNKIKSEEKYVETSSPGCCIHANYTYSNHKIGMSVLGERSKKAEDIGKECAVKLLEEMKAGASTDHYTADQLLIYLAIKCSGRIKVSQVTDHMKSNIEVIEKFLPVKFDIKENLIECSKL